MDERAGPETSPSAVSQLCPWLFEHSTDGIVLGTPGGEILLANPAACRMLGWSEADLREGSRRGLGDALEPLSRALAAGAADETVRTEALLRRADGSTLPVSITTARPSSAGGARPVCALLCDRSGAASAATASRAEEGGARTPDGPDVMREWMESLPAIAWRTDENANIVERNRHWYEFTGRSVQDPTGTDWLDVIHPEDRMRVLEAVETAVCTEGALECEFRVRRVDGVYRWFLGRASPVRDRRGRVMGWMGIGTDIEDRKRAEEALREADQRKNEFLGVLSHELRNPLAPIATSIYILDHADPAGPQARRAREVIARQTAHLGRLVDDLLDVTRIIRGKIELRRAQLDLNEIVWRTAEDHRAVLEKHGLELVVNLPPGPLYVNGDETRITQIVGNILHNAAKFTPRGGRVALNVVRRPGAFEVRVKDNGAGISPELLEHLFEPFAQEPQGLARTSGGLGLGLSLVRGLVELHGGDVQAFSEGPGRGTEIVVTLPSATPEPEARLGPAGAQAMLGRRALRVLVVDDHPDTADSLAQVVEMFGYEADIARDAPSAILRARAKRPDVVLCDIGLPGTSGYEVARALRSEHRGAEMTLVAISGYAQPADLHAAFEAGFDHHLPKPPQLDELQRLLRRCRPPEHEPAAAPPELGG